MTIKVRDLRKSFTGAEGPVAVLEDVSLDLASGETLALTGESGSGKSTLLAILAGLEPFDRGSVQIDGQDIGAMNDRDRAALRRGVVSVVFQQFNLIPSLNVADNIAFQARLAGRTDAAWQDSLTERLGLSAHARKYPEQLSGGQQQRVAIGRTLAARPAYVLADEPTGNLDEATAGDVLDLMLTLVSESGAGLLMVTHSEALAARLSQRLRLSQGRLS